MNICFVVDENIYRPAGVQYYVLDFANWLIDHGHQVTVLHSANKSVADHAINSKIKVINIAKGFDIPFVSPNGGVSVFPGFADKKTVRHILANHSFDVFHFNYPFSPFISARVVKELHYQEEKGRQGVKKVATFHVYVEEQRWRQVANALLAKLLTRSVAAIETFISTGPATDFYGKKYVGRQSVRIPIGIPNVRLPNKRKKQRMILFLGRLQPRKGVLDFVTALAKIPKKLLTNVKIVIAGDGPERAAATSLAAKYQLPIEFIGTVHDEKYALYAKADIAVFPTKYGETFGIVLLEAMNYFCVPLGYANEGYKGTMREYAHSVLVAPSDTTALAKKITQVLCLSEKELHDKQEEYKRFFTRHYDIDIVGEQLLTIYRD